MLRPVFAAALAIALLVASPASAQLVVSNINQPFGGGQQGLLLSASFSPGSTPVVDADHYLRVTSSMQIVGVFSPGGLSDTLFAEIRTDSGGLPGALVASASYSFSIPQTVVNLNPVFEFASFPLTDSTYWINFTGQQNGTEIFYMTNSTAEDAGPNFGWTIGDVSPNSSPGVLPQFSIEVVPEPSTYVLLAMATLVGGVWRWKQRRAAKLARSQAA